jgi:alkanesulfonate monooxygenase SsuD/methylene tetrahydromethanopterin reductase-like flavin-dependent oxidoreductase (luciferase family)
MNKDQAAAEPIRFGYIFDFRNPADWQRPWGQFYAESLDFIAWLETIGYEAVWIPEHHGVKDGYMPSPLMIGAAIAARTKTMRISPAVAIAPLYHPVRLAEDMAVLDVISNGRIELALGVGYLPREAAAYGVDFRNRGRRTDEVLQILLPLLEGETVSFEGEFYSINDARIFPLPVQKPRPSVLVGGVTRPGLRRAARFGDGYCGGVDQYQTLIEEVRALGRDKNPRLDSMTDMWFMASDDPERTMEEIAPHFCYQIKAYADWQEGIDWGIRPTDIETIKASGTITVLRPEDAIALIRKRKEQVPAMESFCMMVPAGLPLSRLAEHAELFAKKVIPAFR